MGPHLVNDNLLNFRPDPVHKTISRISNNITPSSSGFFVYCDTITDKITYYVKYIYYRLKYFIKSRYFTNIIMILFMIMFFIFMGIISDLHPKVPATEKEHVIQPYAFV